MELRSEGSTHPPTVHLLRFRRVEGEGGGGGRGGGVLHPGSVSVEALFEVSEQRLFGTGGDASRRGPSRILQLIRVVEDTSCVNRVVVSGVAELELPQLTLFRGVAVCYAGLACRRGGAAAAVAGCGSCACRFCLRRERAEKTSKKHTRQPHPADTTTTTPPNTRALGLSWRCADLGSDGGPDADCDESASSEGSGSAAGGSSGGDFFYSCRVALYAFVPPAVGQGGGAAAAPVGWAPRPADCFRRSAIDTPAAPAQRAAVQVVNPFMGTVYTAWLSSPSLSALPLEFAFATPPEQPPPLPMRLVDFALRFEVPHSWQQGVPHSDILLRHGCEVSIEEIPKSAKPATQVFSAHSAEQTPASSTPAAPSDTATSALPFRVTPDRLPGAGGTGSGSTTHVTSYEVQLQSGKSYTIRYRRFVRALQAEEIDRSDSGGGGGARHPAMGPRDVDYDVESASPQTPGFLRHSSIAQGCDVAYSAARVEAVKTERVVPKNLRCSVARSSRSGATPTTTGPPQPNGTPPPEPEKLSLALEWDVPPADAASLVFHVQRVAVPRQFLQNTPSSSVLELWDTHREMIQPDHLERFWHQEGGGGGAEGRIHNYEVVGVACVVVPVVSHDISVYRVRSRPVSHNIWSRWSVTTPVRFPTRHPPVEGLCASAVSPSSVSVEWTAAKSPGQPPPSRFAVRYREAGPGHPWVDKAAEGGCCKVVIDSLCPKTQYKVQVSPVGNPEGSQESVPRLLSVQTRSAQYGYRNLS